jgi:hypothetical protein
MTDSAPTTLPLLLDTVPAAQLEAFLPPVSALAHVHCMPMAMSMTIAEAIAVVMPLIPRGPDLDLVALSAPSRLPAAIAHHAAVAVLAAALTQPKS